MIVISIVLIVLSRGTHYQIEISIISTLLPIIVLFLFIFAPKEVDYNKLKQENTNSDKQTQNIVVSFCIFFLSFMASFGLYFILKYKHERYAIRVVSNNLIIEVSNKEEELQDD
jgi:hypothetical protein